MIKYLSRTEVEKRLSLRPGSLSKLKLPEPDAMVGRARGWLPETIDAWNKSRPGSGNWRQ